MNTTENKNKEDEMELAQLKGSEKQIAWAEKIRNTLLAQMEDYDTTSSFKLLRFCNIPEYRQNPELAWMKFITDIRNISEAAFWINNRDSIRAIFHEWLIIKNAI